MDAANPDAATTTPTTPSRQITPWNRPRPPRQPHLSTAHPHPCGRHEPSRPDHHTNGHLPNSALEAHPSAADTTAPPRPHTSGPPPHLRTHWPLPSRSARCTHPRSIHPANTTNPTRPDHSDSSPSKAIPTTAQRRLSSTPASPRPRTSPERPAHPGALSRPLSPPRETQPPARHAVHPNPSPDKPTLEPVLHPRTPPEQAPGLLASDSSAASTHPTAIGAKHAHPSAPQRQAPVTEVCPSGKGYPFG